MKYQELLDTRTLQRFLLTKGIYKGNVDGMAGAKTYAAMRELLTRTGLTHDHWLDPRVRTASEQIFLQSMGFRVGAIDGLIGPSTLDAQERYQNALRDIEPPADTIAHQPTRWPREADVLKFYGPVGQNQTTLQLPYHMRLAWDRKTIVTRIQCHEKVAPSLSLILTKTLDYYGEEKIENLGLDLFGGCLAVRPKKGGKAYSMHSWGIAIDFDPDHNQLRWGRDRARLDDPEYTAFRKFFRDEGWISLGEEKNYDWMHFQAARF